MQKPNLQCRVKPKRRWKSQGEPIIIAPDLLKRDFTASEPNKKWVTDTTYIQYGSTTKYLCWDNAVIESFHSSLKSEEFHYVKFNSLSNKNVIERVTNYLVYYNSERIQEKLDYLTPIKYRVMAAQ